MAFLLILFHKWSVCIVACSHVTWYFIVELLLNQLVEFQVHKTCTGSKGQMVVVCASPFYKCNCEAFARR